VRLVDLCRGLGNLWCAPTDPTFHRGNFACQFPACPTLLWRFPASDVLPDSRIAHGKRWSRGTMRTAWASVIALTFPIGSSSGQDVKPGWPIPDGVRWQTVNGYPLAYRDLGQGVPIVLIAFNVPSDPVAEALIQQRSVIKARPFPGHSHLGITVYELPVSDQ